MAWPSSLSSSSPPVLGNIPPLWFPRVCLGTYLSFLQRRSQCNIVTTKSTVYNKDGLGTIFTQNIMLRISLTILVWSEHWTRQGREEKLSEVNNSHCPNPDILTVYKGRHQGCLSMNGITDEINTPLKEEQQQSPPHTWHIKTICFWGALRPRP